MACTPAVGDSCSSSTDCSAAGDRQCDTAQPGGYCTVVSCGANACPGNAGCVAFQTNVSGCPYTDRSIARTARSYCMKKCGDDGDCRDGYICAEPTGAPWYALKLDDKQSYRICVPAPPQASVAVDAGGQDAEVCQASVDASAIVIPLDPKDAGADAKADADAGAPDAEAHDGSADADAAG